MAKQTFAGLAWRLWHIYDHHQKALMLPFNGIIKDRQILENLKANKYRANYLFPVIFSVILVSDSLFQYNSEAYDPRKFRIFHHCIVKHMPVLFQKQGNIAFSLIFVLILTVNAKLYFGHFPHINFLLLKTDNEISGPRLSLPFRKGVLSEIRKSLGQKLIANYRKSQRPVRMFVLAFCGQCNCSFLIAPLAIEFYMAYSSNWDYIPEVRHIVLICCSTFYFRMYGSAIHIGAQFLSQNGLIQTKQNDYLSRMAAFQEAPIRNKAELYVSHHFFTKIMARILDITREIESLNRFYSYFITILLIIYGVIGCSVLNAVLNGKVSNAPIFAVAIWIFSVLFIYFPFIFMFNSFSSRTIRRNVQLYKSLRKLQMKFLFGGMLGRLHAVKMDLVNEYKLLLQKCSFRLLNSSPINNKLFAFQIFGYVSVLYMKLVSDNST